MGGGRWIKALYIGEFVSSETDISPFTLLYIWILVGITTQTRYIIYKSENDSHIISTAEEESKGPTISTTKTCT